MSFPALLSTNIPWNCHNLCRRLVEPSDVAKAAGASTRSTFLWPETGWRQGPHRTRRASTRSAPTVNSRSLPNNLLTGLFCGFFLLSSQAALYFLDICLIFQRGLMTSRGRRRGGGKFKFLLRQLDSSDFCRRKS